MLENKVISAIVTQQGAIYVATCPEFGTVEQGATEAEAIANLRILNRVYSSIVLPEINPRLIHFDIVDRRAAETLPDFPPIEISAWRAVRLLENMVLQLYLSSGKTSSFLIMPVTRSSLMGAPPIRPM